MSNRRSSPDYLLPTPAVAMAAYVHRRFMFGRQTRDEFSLSSEKGVSKALKSEGLTFLENNPVSLCSVPTLEGLMLVILDGHHRVRYSGRAGLATIPAFIYSLEQVASYNGLEPAVLEKKLSTNVRNSILDFERGFGYRYISEGKPYHLTGITSLAELQVLLQNFDDPMVIALSILAQQSTAVVDTDATQEFVALTPAQLEEEANTAS